MKTNTLTPEDLADCFHVDREQIVRRCRSGEFPHLRIGRAYRFSEADIEAIFQIVRREPKVVPANPWGSRRRGRKAS